MTDRIERELWLPASPDDVWDAVTGDGWLADEVELRAAAGRRGELPHRRHGQDRLGGGGDGPLPARVLVGRGR